MGMIYTTHGDLDESTLEYKTVMTETDFEIVTAHEWYLGDELVKRNVDMVIKQGIFSNAIAST